MMKKKKRMIRRQVFFSPEDWDCCDKLGRKENENASYIVRKFVREGLKRHKGRESDES